MHVKSNSSQCPPIVQVKMIVICMEAVQLCCSLNEDMGKEEITCVQYHHKCRSISTLKKMLRAIFETEHTMSVWCPTYLLHKIKEMLEGPKCETTSRTVFRAARGWTDLKGRKIRGCLLLQIKSQLLLRDITAGHDNIHTHLELGLLPAELKIWNTVCGSRKAIIWRTLYIHPKRTPVKSTSVVNGRHYIMINHLCSPMMSAKSMT